MNNLECNNLFDFNMFLDEYDQLNDTTYPSVMVKIMNEKNKMVLNYQLLRLLIRQIIVIMMALAFLLEAVFIFIYMLYVLVQRNRQFFLVLACGFLLVCYNIQYAKHLNPNNGNIFFFKTQ